jgi:hypothetical protein
VKLNLEYLQLKCKEEGTKCSHLYQFFKDFPNAFSPPLLCMNTTAPHYILYQFLMFCSHSSTQTVQNAIADSEKIKLLGTAEAAAISCVGKADAERMRQKAAVYKQYGDAAIMSIVLEALPKVLSPCETTLFPPNEFLFADRCRSGGTVGQNRGNRPHRRSRQHHCRNNSAGGTNSTCRQCLNRGQPLQSAWEDSRCVNATGHGCRLRNDIHETLSCAITGLCYPCTIPIKIKHDAMISYSYISGYIYWKFSLRTINLEVLAVPELPFFSFLFQ